MRLPYRCAASGRPRRLAPANGAGMAGVAGRADGDQPVVVRSAILADAPALARLTEQADGRSAAWVGSLEVQLRHPERHLVVAESDGVVVGLGRATRFDPTTPGPNAPVDPDAVDDRLLGWHLAGLVVDPGHRRRGLGRQLIEARLGWLRSRTDEVLYVTSVANLASRRLHASMGFEEIGEVASSPLAQFEGGRGVLARLLLR